MLRGVDFIFFNLFNKSYLGQKAAALISTILPGMSDQTSARNRNRLTYGLYSSPFRQETCRHSWYRSYHRRYCRLGLWRIFCANAGRKAPSIPALRYPPGLRRSRSGERPVRWFAPASSPVSLNDGFNNGKWRARTHRTSNSTIKRVSNEGPLPHKKRPIRPFSTGTFGECQKGSDPPVQGLDPGEIALRDLPFRLKKSRK